MMKLTEFIQTTLVLGHEVHSLDQAVSEMLDRMTPRHVATELVPEIHAAVLRREKLASTAIGRGLAIPHAGNLPIDKVIGAMAISQDGIDADSIDAEPVYIIVLLLLPPPPSTDMHRLYRPETEALWRHLGNDEFTLELRRARTEGEIDAALQFADANQFGGKFGNSWY